MQEVINESVPYPVLIAGVDCRSSHMPYSSGDDTMDELEALVETAGGNVCARVFQQREMPDAATYIGEGKLAEMRQFIEGNDVEVVVFDNELSPSQIGNIERVVGVKVLDRSMLILDIFAQHATTLEGKIQVELAQQKYTLPRLIGARPELSRLGGGIGTRGPGETKLEVDRRVARQRIETLKRLLMEIRKNRDVQRRARARSRIPKIAIIGYTNAGKSTLLNFLTDAGVLSEDKLFATLDPTTRKFFMDQTEVLLTDTVGFVRNLPHHLVEAFASTLEEVKHADLLLHIVDASNPEWGKHVDVAQKLIMELGAEETPQILVFNKIDRCTDVIPFYKDSVQISAQTGKGIEKMEQLLLQKLNEGEKEVSLLIPYDKQQLVEQVYDSCKVLSREYEEDGARLRVRASAEALLQLGDFITD